MIQINSEDVINDLCTQIASLTRELAIARAHIHALEKDDGDKEVKS